VTRLACLLLGAAIATPLAAQAPTHSAPQRETAVFSGGCFWGVQAVYEHVKGVIQVTSGFAGGAASTAQYETVSEGTTGHAESVKIVFNPSLVSYATLLKVFFTVAHDPTELNRQGPDVGTQYRSAIWFIGDAQHRTAQAMIDSLTKARAFGDPIVTQVAPLPGFYVAEAYHQDYALHHPTDPYIFINDRPKVSHLRERYPELFAEEPVRYSH